MRFGVYFYPWYEAAKWREPSTLTSPVIGQYRSDNPVVINWQLDGIVRCGFDHLVFELPAISDWSFPLCNRSVGMVIDAIRDRKLPLDYTFMLDPMDWHSRVEDVADLLVHLKERGWEKNLLRGPDGRKILYVFAAYPNQTAPILAMRPDMLIRFPVTFTHWGVPDSDDFRWPEIRPYTIEPEEKGLRMDAYLPPMSYCQFWSPTETQQTINGVAAVIPSYDDKHLPRSLKYMPVVPRLEGQTLARQFRFAVESGADEVLVYGWNEYFEASTIEPSLEYGDFYVELTRRLIAQARAGENVHFPEDLDGPRPAPPAYLDETVRRAARRHPDGLPRWDQDNHVAAITQLQAPEFLDGRLLFRDVEVRNEGIEPWRVASAKEPIRLGVQLAGLDGTVLREGRSELPCDLAPGESCVLDLAVEVAGLPAQDCTATVDMVWEQKFWFRDGGEQRHALTLPIGR